MNPTVRASSYILGDCIQTMPIADREALQTTYYCHVNEGLEMYRNVYLQFGLIVDRIERI